MKAFLALLNVNFKSLMLTSMNVGGRRRRKAATGMGSLIILSLVMLYLSATYSFMLGSTLGPAGGLDIMLMVMVLMATFFPLVFTIFAAQSLVFSTKDIDLVLALPVSAFSVMLARLMALYLEILLMVELLLIPAGVSWLVNGGGGGAGFIVLLLVTGIFLAFIPTLLALIFGGIISLLISRFQRFKNLFTTVFSLLLFGGLMVLILSFNSTFISGAEDLLVGGIDGLRAAMAGPFPPVLWVVQAITQPNILMLLAIIACCLVPFLLIAWLFSLIYKRLLTLLSSHRLKSDYQLKSVRGGSSFGALFRKEARKFFGTPAYLMNAGISYIILIIAAVVAVVFKGAIGEFMAELVAAGPGAAVLLDYLPPILTLLLLFFAGLTFVSCVSISLEGKTLWILKEAPLGTGRIFLAKAGFNFLLGAVTAIICVPLAAYAFSLSIVDMAGILFITLLFTLLVSVSGLFINLLLPRMDAENDTVVIKQSASVIVTMLFSLVMMALLVVLYLLLSGMGVSFALFSLIAGVILALLCLLAIVLLNTKGRKLFAAL